MASENNTEQKFSPVRDIALVLSFLTRLPVGAASFNGRTLAQAAWAFPFAGLVVGGMGGAVLYGFAFMGWSAGLAVLLAMALMALMTGGLHEDGLADVADGFGGGNDPATKLAIMHDSRIGTYGVLALIFSVGIRALALIEIQQSVNAFVVLVAAAVFSRAILPAMMAIQPHARDDGLSVVAGRPSGGGALLAIIIGGGISFDVFYPDIVVTLIAMGLAASGVLLLGVIAKRQIGGQTGDVIGAAQQIAETLFLIAVALTAGSLA
ncbi:MAG: adenosylcobinamide-GDP ribazoletransferase [Rhodospirillales bacterium]|nr:adenosylcobinamide-GDP ribazoletransferase [Rhodospirillales bacterium]